jgi:TonB family protein
MLTSALLGLVLAANLSGPDPTQTGSAFLSWCEKYEAGAENQYSGLCVGYVMGVSEMVSRMPPNVAREFACLPENATNDQAVRVVLKYLRDHPEQLHKARLTLTLDSLRTAFPCSKVAVRVGQDPSSKFYFPDGFKIPEPRKIKAVHVVYPEDAKNARLQGTVLLDVTITTEGKVSDVKVLQGVPLLDNAAVAAVSQWEYEPTILHGHPVPVVMTVTVKFQLPTTNQ